MTLTIMLARYRVPPIISPLPGASYYHISLLPGATYYYTSPLPGATYNVAHYRVPPIIMLARYLPLC